MAFLPLSKPTNATAFIAMIHSDKTNQRRRREQFAAKHPAEWQWIETNKATNAFANSLAGHVLAHGDLSNKQMEALRRNLK